ncbi:integral membrane sensor signal transduction histidine kinase [Chloroherpeton thalassium ATCC 35110]|uniref:histidine kinase n=1 Tax=Chloroherpeton thalassium (strain ATCC 35110 / GB-78) TaxID=517418 RepID=B3QSR2_CHLT3|nr:ATP-binding protein [Chloroherpeton thalassium]ACF14109.1 integral membrane sensor signal transduction histidine kinase [Chloroherpeton thalassium ATCC 35110]
MEQKEVSQDATAANYTQKGYGELIIYALIFISLVAAIFAFNIMLSNKSREDTLRIYCATHQQRSWQKALKSLEQARIALFTMAPTEKPFQEFSKSINSFDLYLTTLVNGGQITINDNEVIGGKRGVNAENTVGESKTVTVKPPEDPAMLEVINELNTVWEAGKNDMLKLSSEVAEGKIDTLLIERMLEYTVREDDSVLDACQEFIVKLGQQSDARGIELQSFQVASLILSLIVFIAMLFRSTVALKNRDKVINERTAEVIRQRDTIAEEKVLVQNLLADLQNTQAQLVHSEKMASLGQMVAGLAHEVNTPLGFVKNNVEVIERNHGIFSQAIEENQKLVKKLTDGDVDDLQEQLFKVMEVSEPINSFNLIEKTRHRIDESIMGLDRISELIINLKNFSRLDEAEAKTAQINECIDSSLIIAKNVVKHRAEVEKDYDPNAVAECFPAQLNQVFLNLITNAAQAIEVDSSENGVSERKVGKIIITTAIENDFVLIKFQDNGKGISPENLKRVFEPFFTTKPVGEGTGLGLAIVMKIIEHHGGKITVKSGVGKGTVFEVRIPKKLSEKHKFEVDYQIL